MASTASLTRGLAISGNLRHFFCSTLTLLAAACLGMPGAANALPPSYSTAGANPYVVTESTNPLLPATMRVGIECDDCTAGISFPFPVTLYGQVFTEARASSNGALQFDSDSSAYNNVCLPTDVFSYAILPHWDDMVIEPEFGIFTETIGTFPTRAFVIEWQALLYPPSQSQVVNFQVVFYEGRSEFEIRYGEVAAVGFSATVGVIKDSSNFTQYQCNDTALVRGLTLLFGGNQPPVANNDSATLPLNSPAVTLDVLANDEDPDGDTLTVSSVTSPANGFTAILNGGTSVSYQPAAGFTGADLFTYTVADGKGGIATGSVAVTVVNHSPIARNDSVTVPEDSSVFINVLANDDFAPDYDEVLTVISAGPAAHGQLILAPGGVTYIPHADYFGPDSFDYTISDGNGGIASANVSIDVQSVNDAPVVAIASGSGVSVNEGASFTLSGTVNDADVGDAHVVTIDWGDGSPATVLYLAAGAVAFSSSHVYVDDSPTGTSADMATITVTAEDGNGGAAQETTVIQVANVAPEIVSIAGPATPVGVGQSAALTVTFIDVGSADTHEVRFNWGDGSPDTVVNSSGYSASADHVFVAPGVYPVTITVIDDDGGVVTGRFDYVVAYDQNTGAVTGGGWIEAPRGSLPSNVTASGRVQFGFVARNHRDRPEPMGEAGFHIAFAKYKFESTSYESLVLTGSRARLQGSGLLEGKTGYQFLLIADDNGNGGSTDGVRLKIWNVSTGVVVFDNGLGAPEGAETPRLSGGNVLVRLH